MTYFDLIKNEIIEFDKLLLDKYSEIGLNETNCIILIKIYNELKNNVYLDENNIIKNMSIDKTTLSEAIINLVNTGYINLEITDSTVFKEKIVLDPTFLKLANCLEGNNQNTEISQVMKDTLKELETLTNKILSPLEISIVKKWFYELNYSETDIKEVLDNLPKTKKITISLIDRLLFSKKQTNETDESKDLFKKLYGKKTG